MKQVSCLIAAAAVLAGVLAPASGVSANTPQPNQESNVLTKPSAAHDYHVNFWKLKDLDDIPKGVLFQFGHECYHKRFPEANYCTSCDIRNADGNKLGDEPDCYQHSTLNATWKGHEDYEKLSTPPACSPGYHPVDDVPLTPPEGFTKTKWVTQYDCHKHPEGRLPRCPHWNTPGYWVGDDEKTVNLGSLIWHGQRDGPDDLTFEVRWPWSDFAANDKVLYTRDAPYVFNNVSEQGHRVFYDNSTEQGPEIVYRPKGWAAGTDRFSYIHGRCEAFVTVTFSDYKPVAERVSVRPELDEKRNADEWSWVPSEATHRHYGWDWKWEQDCDTETTPENLCKLWYQTFEDVKDQWEYQRHGTVVTHRYEGGFYRVSGVGETIETLQNLSDDWDSDLWTWEGFLFSDPETGVLPPLDVSEAQLLAGYAVRSDTVGPAAGIVKTSPINYPHDYSQFYDFGWSPTGETPILGWVEPPGPKHRAAHDNFPAPPPGVIEDPPYGNSWRWEQTDSLSNTMLRRCHLISGRAQVNPGDGGGWICFVWRNKTGDINYASTEQHITVPYWVCDWRAEAYFADRAAARAAGFTAYDYCDKGVLDIGHAPLSLRLYPN